MAEIYDGFISYSHAADDLLAPRLQSALQRFAKPWWKRRAVRIFRDESSLSANPHLWSSITEALDSSSWFVLLLSPDAAQSEWVNQEISYWVENRDLKKILPVVTDGEFAWTGLEISGNAVPEVLLGVFSEEPRWVDLRFAKDEDQLELKNPRFADAVADIASTVRGVPKDELASEEVRQHRRTMRTAWAAGASLVVLALLSAVATGVAIEQRNEAQRLAAMADASAAEAERQALTAVENEALALQSEAVAVESGARLAEQLAISESRRRVGLAAALGSERTQTAMLLLLDAWWIAPTDETRREALSALGQVMIDDRLLTRIALEEASYRAALSPNGSMLYTSRRPSNLLLGIDVNSGVTKWSFDEALQNDLFGTVAVDAANRWLVLAIEGPASRLVVLDAGSGEVQFEIDAGACPRIDSIRFSADGSLLSVSTGGADCGSAPEADWAVVYRTADWTESTRLEVSGGWSESVGFLGPSSHLIHNSWSAPPSTREFLDEGGPLRVVSRSQSATLFSLPASEYSTGDPTGSHLAYLRSFAAPARVVDIATGQSRVLDGGYLDDSAFSGNEVFDFSRNSPLLISGDGSWVSAISASRADQIFDVETGILAITLGYDGPTLDQSWSADGSLLLTVHDDAIRVWDVADSPQRRLAVTEAEDWIALAMERIWRGFTVGECAAYNLDPCPTSVESARSRYSTADTLG